MRMLLVLTSVLGVASVAAAALPHSAIESTIPCDDTTSDYTLKKWMRDNMNGPIEKNDFGALSKALTATASLAPNESDFPNWKSISIDGAKAASNNSLSEDDRMKAVKSICRKCHELYKEKYKANFGTRVVPKT